MKIFRWKCGKTRSDIIRNEKILKPNIREMFTDVYDEMPSQLNEQLTELKDHLLNYKQHYPSETFKPD